MKVLTKDSNEEIIVIDEEEVVEGTQVAFTDEEIEQLKKLLPIADKLLALVSEETEESEEIVDEEENETEIKDEDEDEDEEEDKGKKSKKDKETKDSFSSVGAIPKKKDSKLLKDEQDHQLSVEEAWAKRLGGGK